jgi:hypothetical protein
LRLPYKNSAAAGRSESKFVSTLLQETLKPFYFSFGLKLFKSLEENLGLGLKPFIAVLQILKKK